MYKIFRKSDGVVIQKGDECLPAYIQGVQPYAYKRLVELVKLANEYEQMNNTEKRRPVFIEYSHSSPSRQSPTAKSGKNKRE